MVPYTTIILLPNSHKCAIVINNPIFYFLCTIKNNRKQRISMFYYISANWPGTLCSR